MTFDSSQKFAAGDRSTNRSNAIRAAIWLIGAAAGAAVLFATSNGIGTSPDSVTYAAAARSLAETGRYETIDGGVRSPLTHFPPGLPLVLAAGKVAGAEITTWWRVLNALALVTTIVLAASLAGRIGDPASPAPLLAAVALAASPLLFKVFTMGWSEPLFIALVVGSLAALPAAERSNVRSVAPSALIAGIALLTRYAGAGLVLANVLTVLAAGRRPLRDRLRTALAYVVLAVVPLIVWLVPSFLERDGPLRPMAFAIPGKPHLVVAGRALWSWVANGIELAELTARFRYSFALAVALAVTGAIALVGWSRRRESSRTLALGAFLMSYASFLLLSMTVFDKALGPDERILAPVIVILTVVWPMLPEVVGARRWVKISVLVAGIVYAGAGAAHLVPYALQVHRDPPGFHGTRWRHSPLLTLVRSLPESERLLSNRSEFLLFAAGRRAEHLPSKVDPRDGVARPDYSQEMRRLRARERGGFVIAFFDDTGFRTYFPDETEILALEPSTVVKVGDGRLYRFDASVEGQGR